MCKEGWCVRLAQERVVCDWGQLSGIPYKGVEQKKREGKQDFKKGGKLGQGVGALKGGLETPYELCSFNFVHTMYTKVCLNVVYLLYTFYVLYTFCIHYMYTSCTAFVYKMYTQFP